MIVFSYLMVKKRWPDAKLRTEMEVASVAIGQQMWNKSGTYLTQQLNQAQRIRNSSSS